MNLTIHGWAALSIGIMVVVIVWMDWVPTVLNRNIQRMSVRERLPGTIIHSLVGALFVVANLLVLKWAIAVGAVWFSVVLWAAVRNWWLAYFGGVYWGEITPEVYTNQYAGNLTLLPRFKHHLVVPDVQHTLIHAAVVIATICSWLSFWMT